MSYVIDKKASYLSQYDSLRRNVENEASRKAAEGKNAINAAESAMRKAEEDARRRGESRRSDALTAKGKNQSDAHTHYDNEIAAAKRKYENDTRATIERMESSIRDFYAHAPESIVTMPPYMEGASTVYEAPRLDCAPTFDQIKEQASKRTYLPKLLVGMTKRQYGSKSCVLPTYVDWQSEEDKTTATKGNLMLLYDCDASARQAHDLVDEMITRMLMSFPIGSLRLSLLDPMNRGDVRITKEMGGCEELYNKKVYNTPAEVEEHLRMLTDKIGSIKEEFKSFGSTSLSLVQHNRDGLKHEYELVIVYDPFSERPSANLKKLLTNGISAGIYTLIVQRYPIKSDAAREFDFSSFNSVIMANENNLRVYKNDIQWNGNGFIGDEYIDCEYLPTHGELINPLAISKELVLNFYQEMSDGWQKATKSLTTKQWSSWNEPYTAADIECWTSGIKVPIGINADNKNEMYFQIENNDKYLHSFVLGMTRSGKSKFLCSTISSIAMKYSPKAVQMYLFDFKNGMAFTCFKGVPHMRWLVTTQADKEMFLSVLRDLENEQNRRTKLFEACNVRDLEPYNKKMLEQGKECLPRILLVVDECQDIYKAEKGINNRQSKINQLFNEFAKKYGAFGIHLILSSQEVPSDMTWIGQVRNNYILNAGDVRFGQLLNANNKGKVDDIQKRILGMPKATGMYSAIDDAYISMLGYEDYENAGQYIYNRAKDLLGAHINDFTCKEWTGELDKLAPYTKAPISKSMEFGVDLTGEKTIGVNIYDAKSNIMIYGAQGDELAKKLTMRTVLSTLRAQIALRKLVSDPKDLATIYIVNAWAEEEVAEKKDFFAARKSNVLEQSTVVMKNLAGNGFIKIVKTNELGDLLLQLKKQIEGKQSKSVLLYIIGSSEIDLLNPGVKIAENGETVSEAMKTSGPSWKKESKYGNYGAAQADNEIAVSDVLKLILEQGPDYGIHTVLQVNEKNDMNERNISSRDFQYVIFQQAAVFTSWPDNVRIDLETPLDKLPVDESVARTLFYDAKKANQEPLVIPFMIDDLAAVAKRGESVGQYILDNTQIAQ